MQGQGWLGLFKAARYTEGEVNKIELLWGQYPLNCSLSLLLYKVVFLVA